MSDQIAISYQLQIVSSIAGKPSSGQVALIFKPALAVTIPGNAAGSTGTAGVNPAATAVYSILKNGSSVGTISISTSGVFTFATTGGSAISLTTSDRLTITAPSPQDANLSDVGITLVCNASGTSNLTFDTSGGTTGTANTLTVGDETGSAAFSRMSPGFSRYSGQTFASLPSAAAGNAGSLAFVTDSTTDVFGTAITGGGSDKVLAFSDGTQWTVAAALSSGAGSGTVTNTAGALTAHAVILGNGGNDEKVVSSLGTSGQVLTSNGTGSDPSWQTPSGGGGDTTAEYIIGTTDATLTNAIVWPGLAHSPDVPPVSPGSLDDEFDGTFSGWTFINQGSATAANSDSWLRLYTPSGGTNLRLIVKTMPSGVWEVTARVTFVPSTYGNFVYGGLVARDSSSGKIQAFSLIFNSDEKWVVDNHNDAVSGAASFAAGPTLWRWSGQVWMRLHDDTTNFLFSLSRDGANWIQVASVSRTSFLASPNQVGLYVATEGGSDAMLTADYFRRTV